MCVVTLKLLVTMLAQGGARGGGGGIGGLGGDPGTVGRKKCVKAAAHSTTSPSETNAFGMIEAAVEGRRDSCLSRFSARASLCHRHVCHCTVESIMRRRKIRLQGRFARLRSTSCRLVVLRREGYNLLLYIYVIIYTIAAGGAMQSGGGHRRRVSLLQSARGDMIM